MNALGCQMLVEAYGCDAALLDDVESIARHMIDAAIAARATVIGHRFHRFAPHGVSGVVVISESHLAIHTWPEHGYAALDLFTCGETVDTEQCFALLRQRLGCERLSVTKVSRGDTASIEAATGKRFEPIPARALPPPLVAPAPPRVSDQILGSLARLGESNWGRLLDAQDGTLAEFHAALDAHRAAGRVRMEAGVASLTDAGRAALGPRGNAPSYDLACPSCDARGYRVAEGDSRAARLHELLADRPPPNFDFDQGAITPEDALIRASFIEDRGDLTGRSLLFIGDFDLLSLPLVMTGKPERVVVLDIDTRVVEFLNRTAAKHGFPLEARNWDVRLPLPADLEGQFDVFLCDPVETLPGIRLFLSRGVAGLRGAGTAAYVGLTTLEASRRKWYEIQRACHDMGFVVTDARRRFSGYPDHDEAPRDPGYSYPIVDAMGPRGVEHRWYTASLLRLEAVRAPVPLISGEVPLGPELYVDDEAWATPRR
jgi:S-adenosylmethionine decarboxylase proenzyme